MTTEVSYWDCKFIGNYEEVSVNGEDYRTYGCDHPENTEFGHCPIDNKWGDKTAYCPLLDKSITLDEARVKLSDINWVR